jgi:hypothetical protein
MSRHQRAIIHQHESAHPTAHIDWNQLDPPPALTNSHYLNSLPEPTFRLKDLPKAAKAHFIIESVIIAIIALADPQFIFMLNHPSLTFNIDSVFTAPYEVLLLQFTQGTLPLPYLPRHWIKYHSDTTFSSLTHEYNFHCYESLCPFNICTRFYPYPSISTSNRLSHYNLLLSINLYDVNISDIFDYLSVISSLKPRQETTTLTSPLMTALRIVLSKFYLEHDLNYLFSALD